MIRACCDLDAVVFGHHTRCPDRRPVDDSWRFGTDEVPDEILLSQAPSLPPEVVAHPERYVRFGRRWARRQREPELAITMTGADQVSSALQSLADRLDELTRPPDP